MSQIAIYAFALNSAGELYQSLHTEPELQDFIVEGAPGACHGSYQEGGKAYYADTSEPCTVTAAETVTLPTGEKRKFSYWIYPRATPGPEVPPLVKWWDRELHLYHGEHGWVALWFGVERPRIYWPRDVKDFNLFVHLMMRHAPSWEPPTPQPWTRSEAGRTATKRRG